VSTLTAIRTAREDDLDQILELEQQFSDDPIHWASREHFLARIRKFPEGFFLGFTDDHLVTMLMTCCVHYDPSNPTQFTSWKETTNQGRLHDKMPDNANALYIVSGVVDKTYRKYNYFHYGLDELTKLANSLGLSYIVAGASMLGYKRYCEKYGFVPAHEYALLTKRGRSFDPLLERYRRIGFTVPNRQHVIPDYFEHAGSMNYAALVVRELGHQPNNIHIDFNHPDCISDPYPIYQKLCVEQPVYHHENGAYYIWHKSIEL